MPRIHPASITFKCQRSRRVLNQMEGFAVKDGLLTIYTAEPGIKEGIVKKSFGRTEKVQQQIMQEVPIIAYPLQDIDKIDFGYGTMEEAKARYDLAMKEKQEKEAYEASKNNADTSSGDSITEPTDGNKEVG